MSFGALFLGVFLLSDPTGEDRSEPIAAAVSEEIGRIRPGSLWPGFDPASVPLAFFDGERTYLFRHPSPPPEFEPLPRRPAVRVFSGQHPLVRANSSAVIGGAPVATLLSSRGDARGVRELASIAVHEMFHVFQSARHPKWGGNEVDLFTYPIDDPPQLQLSRLETEALRRALDARRDDESACWASVAVELRTRRFALLGDVGAAYERGTELKEGLAQLVESRARGATNLTSILPRDGFPAGEVRTRSYAIGQAFGALLDRFSRGWEGLLETADLPDRPLDALLAEALRPRARRRCRFSRSEVDESLSRARRSIELAALTRQAVRKDFLERGGWKVVVVAGSQPLSVERFDPLNVERLGGGEILHTRWVKLAAASGSIEVLDRRALTESAGAHPLFEGVRRLTVTGLPEEPRVSDSGGYVSIRGPGLTADFRAAALRRANRTLFVTLEEAR
jgi:hypothetical protein